MIIPNHAQVDLAEDSKSVLEETADAPIESGAIVSSPNICCIDDADSSAHEVVGSCRHKKIQKPGSVAAASSPYNGGVVDCYAPSVVDSFEPSMKLVAFHARRSLSVLFHACAQGYRTSSRSKFSAGRSRATQGGQAAPPRWSHARHSLYGKIPSMAWASCSTASNSASARSTGAYRTQPA